MTDLSALSKFADDQSGQDEPIKPMVPHSPSRRILSFDQSIANTGWAYLHGRILVAQGNLKTEGMAKGHEDTLQRAVVQWEAMAELIGWYTSRSMTPTFIVHETPPVGGKMVRPESSLTSALSLRIAAAQFDLPLVMIGAQKGKKRWTGNGNATKKELREALYRLKPSLEAESPMNEAIRDAISIGWVAMEMETT